MRIIDLFAGIGGTRLGFEGCECVFTSEIDKFARQTYQANFDGEIENFDITQQVAEDVPDHDILLAGFPCQAFSNAGLKKGFKDARGTLFFDVARILAVKKPPLIFLENVPNLQSHDKGKTFKVIRETLEGLGYTLSFFVINAIDYVPQNRKRIYILGSLEGQTFDKPWTTDKVPTIHTILEKDVPDKYTISDEAWAGRLAHKAKHADKGNGFGYGLVTKNTLYTRTLTARYYKDGSEILIEQDGKNPRRLTPRECARLMGFPDSFVIPVSDSQAYKQFGNSIVVPVVKSLAKLMIK